MDLIIAPLLHLEVIVFLLKSMIDFGFTSKSRTNETPRNVEIYLDNLLASVIPLSKMAASNDNVPATR